MGETGWQVQYHATAVLEDIGSSACAQDNGAVPQPQHMTFRSHCCVCFILLQLNTLLAYSHTLAILTL